MSLQAKENKSNSNKGGGTKSTKVSDQLVDNDTAPLPSHETEIASSPSGVEGTMEEGEEGRLWVICSESAPKEKMPCGHEGCQKDATETWTNTLTGDKIPLCSDCPEKYFQQATATTATTNDGTNLVGKDSPITSNLSNKEPLLSTPSTSEAKTSLTALEEDCKVAEEEDEENGPFALIDFVPLAKLKTGGRLCNICVETIQEHPTSSPQPNMACTVWQSTDNPKSKKWFYCLDCLAEDFESFPDYDELVQHNALTHLDPSTFKEHVNLMKVKCSRQLNPTLPCLPPSFLSSSETTKSLAGSDTNNQSHFITPPPKSARSNAIMSDSSLHPQESVPKNATSVPAKVTPKALAVHKKWQEQAEAFGGKGTKIVVHKEKAKKIVYTALKDAFRPMNINDIYKHLKAVIPQPVLASTLKNMADQNASNPFQEDSDEEDTKPSPKEDTEADGDDILGRQSLVFKAGRNPQTSLYHFNYKKAKEMESDERQELLSSLYSVQATADGLKNETTLTLAQAAELQKQPTNVDLITLLDQASSEVEDLRAKVIESRKLQVHTGTRINLQKKIQNMASHWGKRKRICLSFLSTLEENTEGAVTIQKSLAGDGPLQLDSDESAVKAELGLAKQKSQKAKMGINRKQASFKKQKTESSLSASLSSSLVAVRLVKGGKVERVYYEDD